jgi:hypothetical protein
MSMKITYIVYYREPNDPFYGPTKSKKIRAHSEDEAERKFKEKYPDAIFVSACK